MNTEVLATSPASDRPAFASGERLPVAVLLLGLAAICLPTLWHLAVSAWSGDEQGHGPVILLVSLWLFWRRGPALLALPYRPARVVGAISLVLAVATHVTGRALEIVQFEVGALIVAAAAVLLLLRGWAALRLAIFPLFMLLFIVPLPGVFVQTVTVPLKTVVLAVAQWT